MSSKAKAKDAKAKALLASHLPLAAQETAKQQKMSQEQQDAIAAAAAHLLPESE